MKIVSGLTTLTLCGALIAGCAPSNISEDATLRVASFSPETCFRSNDIVNVNVTDSKTLYVETKRGYVFRLDAPTNCFEQGATISVTEIDTRTCVGNRALTKTGGRYRSATSQCIAQISGPFTDTRATGLWARQVAP